MTPLEWKDAKAPLTVASYQKCSRTLAPGEVKRVMQRGPLVGYFLACPACGFSASYLDEQCGFEEDPPKGVMLHDLRVQRVILSIKTPPRCFRCRRYLRVVDGHLEAVSEAP